MCVCDGGSAAFVGHVIIIFLFYFRGRCVRGPFQPTLPGFCLVCRNHGGGYGSRSPRQASSQRYQQLQDIT